MLLTADDQGFITDAANKQIKTSDWKV